MVLWLLYEEYVCACAYSFVGRSMKTSKQFIITVVLFPNEYWKHCGMVAQSWSLSGQ